MNRLLPVISIVGTLCLGVLGDNGESGLDGVSDW
jgi:hypothetical protein